MHASPLAATRSQPTNTALTHPFFITWDAMLSQMTVVSTPSAYSSKEDSRAPCSSGRVSSQNTLKFMPFSRPRWIGARAVPYFEVAS